MSLKNSAIVERIWLEGSNAFQQRIPNPSVSGMAATIDALFDPYNNDMYNEFTGMLNGIANTYVYQRRFMNPYREVKKDPIRYGNTERMVATKYLQAHSYKMDDETLLKLERPEYVEWFYSVNYQTRYEFSWIREEVQRAFASDGLGFNNLLAATVDAMVSSDQVDEMNTMLQMFAEGDSRWGLYREQVSAIPTDKATAQELLVKIKAIAARMKYPTTLYNGIDVPVFETTEGEDVSLILWVTPETDSVISVMALADLFNIDEARVRFRKYVVPEFPIPNVVAALTSEDFIYWRDKEYGIYDFWNASNLSTKNYLHHWAMVGVNPAANCVLFTTEESTVIPTVTVEPTGLAFNPANVEVAAGDSVQLNINLTGNVTGDNPDGRIAVEPDAAVYSVAAVREGDSGATPVALNSRTYVDARGILHTQKTLEVGDIITITAKSAYINPSGETQAFTATATATIVAPTNGGMKECSVEEKPYIEYVAETDSVSASE